MNSLPILDHDVLTEQLNKLDKTLIKTTASEAVVMLEEVAGELDCDALFNELNIPILTDVFEVRNAQNPRIG